MKAFLVKFFSSGNPSEQSVIAQTVVKALSPSDALLGARETLKQSYPEIASCKYHSTETYKGGGG